jgi:DNA-binding response OmpR family regulator
LPPPTAEKIADARKEASTGGPQLARSGFYVAMARHATGGPVPPRDGERHTILVVDDDYNLVKLVTEVLGMAGFDVRIARNGAGINHEINRTPLPDLMLLDVALPDADGFEILERIRADERIATLPVIMMTGKSEIADVARGLALSADGYVTKPFKMTALVAAVNTVLGLA